MIDGTVEPPYRPYKAVEECASIACGLQPLRGGRRDPDAPSALTAIRSHCFSCLGGNGDSIRLGGKTYTRSRPRRFISRCQQTHCALYPFRLGRRD